MKNIDVVKAFIRGDEHGTGGHIFIDKNVLFSYGEHFPMAIRLKDSLVNNSMGYKFIVNKDTYSKTTSRHQSMFLKEINKNDIIKEVRTHEMRNFVNIESVREAMLKALDD